MASPVTSPRAATISLWRIAVDAPAYRATALDGAGAERTGGRWNQPGTPVVYTSTSRALACLETLVHLNQAGLPLRRLLVEIRVPAAVWASRIVLRPGDLEAWDVQPASLASQRWGSAWARGARAVLAEVPSVIVPEEADVLINPRHAEAELLRAVVSRTWTYDGRLTGR